jgi:4-amino-4-deoxy-L-arabinose transferase-like glycosyltransferase
MTKIKYNNTVKQLLPRKLAIILTLAFTLRIMCGLSQPGESIYDNTGGDSSWYLANGYTLVTGQDSGIMPVDVSKLPSAPLYLIFTGLIQAMLPQENTVIAIRLVQALMGTAICYFVYRIVESLSEARSAGLLAAIALAISPVFIIESAQILTETLYMFLLFGGMFLYMIATPRKHKSPDLEVVSRSSHAKTSVRSVPFLAIGVLFGLATLTRAVLLLFPVCLAVHLLIVESRQRSLKRYVILLTVYGLVVSSWTIYNWLKWDHFVIGGEGFSAFLYIGATAWESPEAVDQNLAQDARVEGNSPVNPENQQDVYRDTALKIIGRDPLGWISHRIQQMASAILQPHGTEYYRGESLKQLANNWIQSDRSLDGLFRMSQSNAFWPKLVIYLFHYTAILFGFIGIWLTRDKWRLQFPLVLFILYTLGVHFFLEAIPRYIFPATVILWIFAAIAIVEIGKNRLWPSWSHIFHRTKPQSQSVSYRSEIDDTKLGF